MSDVDKLIDALEARTVTWPELVARLHPGCPDRQYAEGQTLDLVRSVVYERYVDPTKRRDMEARLAAKVTEAKTEAVDEFREGIYEHLNALRTQLERMGEWRHGEYEDPEQTRTDLASHDAPNTTIRALDSVIAAFNMVIQRIANAPINLEFDVDLDDLR